MYDFKKTPELNSADVDVIRAMARCDMDSTKAAQELHYHVGSVKYHIQRIKRITGLNPRRFFNLQELLRIVGEN